MAETVYGKFDQETLDREYSPSSISGEPDPFIEEYAKLSAQAREHLECHEDVAYGDTVEEVLDIFVAGDKAPAQIFYHGGYWQALSQKESAMNAPDFAENGVTTIVVNYALCPAVSLDEIVRQSRAAAAWVYKNAEDYGIDRNRIYLSGHSAGAHLAAMVAASDWSIYGLPTGVVKGVTAVSGIYDLEPIRLSYVNEALHLDEEAAFRNSPQHHLPPQSDACPLIVTWGEGDTREFHRQGREFAQAWDDAGYPAESFVMEAFHHFDIILKLGRRGNRLGDAVYAQMGL